jgi:hypothetical protein
MRPYINRRGLLVLGSAALLLSGCASAPTPADYADQKPTLDLRQYFNGPLVAHGLFTDRAGKVQRRFTVQLKGSWQGDDGVLEEDFLYNDGKTERRVWRIRHLGGGQYTGRADDVVGEARGEAAGNALRWRYTLQLPVDGSVYDVNFDDWMFLMDDKIMLNKAKMSKFGIHLGGVTLSFTKL